MRDPRPSWLPWNAADRALDEHTVTRWTERSIEDLAIGPVKTEAIARLGVLTLGEVRGRLPEIAKLRGFGPTTIKRIEAVLLGFQTGEGA